MNRIAEYEELIDAIKNGVCEEYGCDLGSMSAKSGRKKAYVEPRHIAIHLCRKHLDASYKDLAEKFGMSDHTSAMHAHNTISWLSERDKRISRIKRTAICGSAFYKFIPNIMYNLSGSAGTTTTPRTNDAMRLLLLQLHLAICSLMRAMKPS